MNRIKDNLRGAINAIMDDDVNRIKDKLLDVINAIDDIFGDGYAKKNPDLVGRLLQSEALIEGWQEVIHALRNTNVQ